MVKEFGKFKTAAIRIIHAPRKFLPVGSELIYLSIIIFFEKVLSPAINLKK